jgi:hypothetical protein
MLFVKLCGEAFCTLHRNVAGVRYLQCDRCAHYLHRVSGAGLSRGLSIILGKCVKIARACAELDASDFQQYVYGALQNAAKPLAKRPTLTARG